MGKNIANTTHTFFFCDGGSCQKAGSEKVIREARAYLKNSELWDTTHTIKTRCNGRCEDAPTCIVSPGEFWYKELTPEKIAHIVKGHLENDTPTISNLLYRTDWEKHDSNNERNAIKPKPFELKNDKELGECYLTKGFSSDQYLYPLFLHLFENPKGIIIKINDKAPIEFKEILAVDYSKKFTLELATKTDAISLIIAAVPKEDNELQKLKISITEYFYKKENKQLGIRFKNKFGNTIAHIFIDNNESNVWSYCEKIQLLNTNLIAS